MPQSNVIFGFVFLAFLAFITLRNELPIYAGLLLLGPPGGSGDSTSAIGNSVKAAGTAASMANPVTGLISFGLSMFGIK